MNPDDISFDIKLMQWCSNICLLVFVASVLATAGLYVMRHPYFSIRNLTVQGELTKVNDGLLLQSTVNAINGTLFTARLGDIKSALESTPWVRRVVVHRQYPNGLRIDLQEHQAVALWGESDEDEEAKMVNPQGEIFEANRGDIETDNLPRLSGPQEQAPEILAMFWSLSPLFVQGSQRLVGLTLSGRGTWSAQTDAGSRIEIGSGTPAELKQRLSSFFATLPIVGERFGRAAMHLESADLRHANAYALRLRGVTTDAVITHAPSRTQ